MDIYNSNGITMRTIDVFVIGTLALGTAYMIKEYTMSYCEVIETGVIQTPIGQYFHQEIRKSPCYLMPKGKENKESGI